MTYQVASSSWPIRQPQPRGLLGSGGSWRCAPETGAQHVCGGVSCQTEACLRTETRARGVACVSASRRLMPREARDRGTREARVSRRTRRKTGFPFCAKMVRLGLAPDEASLWVSRRTRPRPRRGGRDQDGGGEAKTGGGRGRGADTRTRASLSATTHTHTRPFRRLHETGSKSAASCAELCRAVSASSPYERYLTSCPYRRLQAALTGVLPLQAVNPGGYASLDCLCRDINSPSSNSGGYATRSPRPIKRLWPSLTGTCPSQDVSLAGTCPSQGRVPHRDVSAHQAAIKDVLTVCRSASTQDHEKIRTRFGWFACAGAPQRGQHRDLPPPKPGHCTPHLACRTRPSAHTRVNTR